MYSFTYQHKITKEQVILFGYNEFNALKRNPSFNRNDYILVDAMYED